MSDDFDITSPTPLFVSEHATKRKAPKAMKPKRKPKRLDLASQYAEAVREPPEPVRHEEPCPPLREPPHSELMSAGIAEMVEAIDACGVVLAAVGVRVWWRPVVDAIKSRRRSATAKAFADARAIRDAIRDEREPTYQGGTRWVTRSMEERFQSCVMRLAGFALGWDSFDDAWMWIAVETAALNAYVSIVSGAGGQIG